MKNKKYIIREFRRYQAETYQMIALSEGWIRYDIKYQNKVSSRLYYFHCARTTITNRSIGLTE